MNHALAVSGQIFAPQSPYSAEYTQAPKDPNARLLYVAMTRATRELLLTTETPAPATV